jgi:GNAT superfamily N-acetyltransferase
LDISQINTKVLENNLKRLRDRKERIDSFAWLKEFAKDRKLSLNNFYFQLKKIQALREGKLKEGERFKIEFPSSEDIKTYIKQNKKEFYRIAFELIYNKWQVAAKENKQIYLELMRDLIISDTLEDRELVRQMGSAELEEKISGFKTFYEDYKNHLPDSLDKSISKIKGLGKLFYQFSEEVYNELGTVVVIEKQKQDTYQLLPQGFLAVFRGRAGIVDCSFDTDKGVPFTRAMHEDTFYYFVYKGKKLKGYIGLLLGQDERGRKILTIDTINSPSLDGEALLSNLFKALSNTAAKLGAEGIALPADMGLSFNFDNKRTIAGMKIYQMAKNIKVRPLHQRSWNNFTEMFNEDSYNSIETGKFKLLDIAGSVAEKTNSHLETRGKGIAIEEVSPEDWPEIKNKILEVEEVFPESLRQDEGDIANTFLDPASILVVIKDGGRIIGYAMGGPLEDYDYIEGVKKDANYGRKNTVYLESIALLSEYQGRGLGRELRHKFEEISRQRGYEYISGHIIAKAIADREDYVILTEFENWQDSGEDFVYHRRLLLSDAGNEQSSASSLAQTESSLKEIGYVVTKKQERLSIRYKKETESILWVKFFNETDQEVGSVNIIIPQLNLNYVYVEPDFRGKNYSSVMIGVVLKGLQEGIFTGQKIKFLRLYLRNPLIADILTDYGFLLKEHPTNDAQRLRIEVVISKEKYPDGKVRIYIEDEQKKQIIIKYINDPENSDWHNFVVTDVLPEGEKSTVTIFAEYYLSNFDKLAKRLAELQVSFSPKTDAVASSLAPEENEPARTRDRDAGKGGIDLSNIELTLKDEAFISSLNPADLKILRAGRALKQNWGSLSLLYIHEIMLLLKDSLVQDIQNKGLLLEILGQLKLKGFLDYQALQFFNFLSRQQPLSEIKVALSNPEPEMGNGFRKEPQEM